MIFKYLILTALACSAFTALPGQVFEMRMDLISNQTWSEAFCCLSSEAHHPYDASPPCRIDSDKHRKVLRDTCGFFKWMDPLIIQFSNSLENDFPLPIEYTATCGDNQNFFEPFRVITNNTQQIMYSSFPYRDLKVMLSDWNSFREVILYSNKRSRPKNTWKDLLPFLICGEYIDMMEFYKTASLYFNDKASHEFAGTDWLNKASHAKENLRHINRVLNIQCNKVKRHEHCSVIPLHNAEPVKAIKGLVTAWMWLFHSLKS